MRTLRESKTPAVCNRCTNRLTATLREQQAEAAKVAVAIHANLKDLGYGD